MDSKLQNKTIRDIVIDDNHRMQIFDSEGKFVDQFEFEDGSKDGQLAFYKYGQTENTTPSRHTLNLATDW